MELVIRVIVQQNRIMTGFPFTVEVPPGAGSQKGQGTSRGRIRVRTQRLAGLSCLCESCVPKLGSASGCQWRSAPRSHRRRWSTDFLLRMRVGGPAGLTRGGIFDAAKDGLVRDGPGYADDEQITQSLGENQFGGDT